MDCKHKLRSSMIDYVRRSKLRILSCLHPLTFRQLTSLTWKTFVRINEWKCRGATRYLLGCCPLSAGGHFIFYLLNCSPNLTTIQHKMNLRSSSHVKCIEVKENLAADVKRWWGQQSSCRQHCSRAPTSKCKHMLLFNIASRIIKRSFTTWQKPDFHKGKGTTIQTCSKLKSDFGLLLTQEREYGEQKERQKLSQFEVTRANAGIMITSFHNSSPIPYPFLSILSHVPSRYSR